MIHSHIEKLTDSELLTKVKTLSQKERELTLSVLHHLREVERRKLYSALKYPSLYEYCRHELGYSSGAAHRRIDSMKLLKEIPELEQSVTEGKLSLSTLSQAQSFFRAEQKTSAPKIDLTFKKALLQELEGKSSREVERELIRHASEPEVHFKEKSRLVSETHTELKLILDENAMKNLGTLKGWLAHSHPNMSLSELVIYLAQLGIEKLDPARKGLKEKTPDSFPALEMNRSRYVARPLRRAVFRRDQGKCTQCGSRHGLELDHRHPFAKNGEHSLENLRLLCRNCNRRHAIESYGLRKIESSTG